ncbi:MAG: MFS transporter [Rubrivivax sp.]|nr:MAG: MFS transporter [Rubrivivax sp.]
MTAALQGRGTDLRAASWSLLAGNFFIGCGVMVVNGTLNDLTQSLGVSVVQGGQLIALCGVMMGVGAPVLATLLSRVDRRWLLSLTMLWYALGHGLSALAPNYEALCVVRAATVLSAAVFTPQAAATMGFLAPPAQRGRAITFVFIGWALASVLGVPLTAWIGERLGWRLAMGLIAAGSLASAVWVHASVPRNVLPPRLTLDAWRQVFSSPVLVAVVLVSCLQSAGQVTVLAFIAPYFKQVHGASPEQISLVFAYFGGVALLGNIILNKVIDRVGAGRAVTGTLALIAVGMAAWPLAGSLAGLLIVFLPWALSSFATNSAQQARLGMLSPALSPALMALNTSAIYTGHALGAGGGSWVISAVGGYAHLHWLALAWMLVAVALSAWAQRRADRPLTAASWRASKWRNS